MGIYIGSQKIDHVYKGTTELSTIRIGEEMTSLIEGDDFVRAKWLVGNGRFYLYPNVWQNILEIKVGEIIPNPINTVVGYFSLMPNDTARIQISLNGAYLLVSFRQSGISHIADINPYAGFGSSEMKFYVDNGIATCLQDGVIHSGQTLTESDWNSDIKATVGGSKISYIREKLPNSTYRFNLTPCRLLHAIPSTFDANGIARNADECGMYDSISGLFYGNVGSGSFSVTNE